MASMMSQYGVRMYSEDFKKMSWNEFSTLLSGIGADTPLGNLVQIRLETDEKILKHFNSSQRKIRDEWQRKQINDKSTKLKHMDFLNEIQKAFAEQGGEMIVK